MNAAWLVARWEYTIRIRSKFFLISTLLMPLLIVGMMYLPMLLIDESDVRGLELAIVDASGEWAGQIGQLLDERHNTSDGIPLYPRWILQSESRHGQRAEAIALLEAGVIEAYLVIEPEFITKGEVSYVTRDQGRVFEQEQLRRAVQSVWTQAAFQSHRVDPELLATLNQDIAWTSYASKGKSLSAIDEMQAFMTPIIYVMILFFAVFFSSQILMRSIITERGSRVVEMLLSSITSRDLMTGKILGLGLVGLTQIAIYLLVASLAGVGRGVELISAGGAGYFILYAILGYFFYAAIYASVGSLFETEQEAQQVVGLLSLIPILPLVFSSYVIIHPEALVVRIASFFPPLTPFLMIIRLEVTKVPWWEVAGTALVLALFTLLMMRWAGVIFRTAILLYGKRITLPEIVRWVKVG
ncbi:MAG: ABC transporter permease [Fidelibacterota bacterium]|nr:MAG: ABC transporter permease [Candidatus Neomarinimicrobiota bacterium]